MGRISYSTYTLLEKIYLSKLSKILRFYNNESILNVYKYLCKKIQIVKSIPLRKKIDTNTLTQEDVNNLTYQDLLYLKAYNLEYFKETATHIYNRNILEIQKKTKIKVVFYLYTISLWSCERLYRLFENDERFDPIIIVVKRRTGTEEIKDREYEETVQYFKTRGYQTIGVADKEYIEMGWNEIGKPDIIMLLTPYKSFYPVSFSLTRIPLSCLNIYIPYGLSATGNYDVFDAIGAQICWKYLAETETTKKVISKHSELKGFNVLVSGHPKMDVLLKPDVQYNPEAIWKIPPGKKIDEVKKIIYAPHHSIYNETIKFSTFHLNHKEIYEFAKKHPETSWVVKPHQDLKQATINTGLFATEDDYDAYMDHWDALSNARTVRLGSYEDIFLTSDAMIMDCGSFLTEYTITNKPLIFLRRPEQKFTEWGNELLNVLYSVNGDDIEAIEEIITNIIINGNDYLQEKRGKLLQSILGIYDSFDGDSTASDFIYHYIKDTFNNKSNQQQ